MVSPGHSPRTTITVLPVCAYLMIRWLQQVWWSENNSPRAGYIYVFEHPMWTSRVTLAVAQIQYICIPALHALTVLFSRQLLHLHCRWIFTWCLSWRRLLLHEHVSIYLEVPTPSCFLLHIHCISSHRALTSTFCNVNVYVVIDENYFPCDDITIHLTYAVRSLFDLDLHANIHVFHLTSHRLFHLTSHKLFHRRHHRSDKSHDKSDELPCNVHIQVCVGSFNISEGNNITRMKNNSFTLHTKVSVHINLPLDIHG